MILSAVVGARAGHGLRAGRRYSPLSVGSLVDRWRSCTNDSRFTVLIGVKLWCSWDAAAMRSRCGWDASGARTECDWHATAMPSRRHRGTIVMPSRRHRGTIAMPSRRHRGPIAVRLGCHRDANRDAIGVRMSRIRYQSMKVIMDGLIAQGHCWEAAVSSYKAGMPCACQSYRDGVPVAS